MKYDSSMHNENTTAAMRLLQSCMLDRYSQDKPDYTLGRLDLQTGQHMLCLAPHPDDEVLGCGGLLMQAQRKGLQVRTVIVTEGQAGVELDDIKANPRLEESYAAARVMGLLQPDCWQLPDRQLRYTLPLIERIAHALQHYCVDWLLLPALTEPHPDHQVLALAGMAAARSVDRPVDILFYEVGAPGQVNVLVDISADAQTKWQALACFISQEAQHSYLQLAQNMAGLRAFGQSGIQAAEAFWHLKAQELRQQTVMANLAFWPLQRNSLGLASEPAQQPLVSVIIRSMQRQSLVEAVHSVALQTYANIEVLLVNASGMPHPVPLHPELRLQLRVINPETLEISTSHAPSTALGRSAAANLGLCSARGELVLFLDDDDLLQPQHIESLVQALLVDQQAVAAYSGVRVENAQGQWLRDYDQPWESRRLHGINYLPIHAVLFRLQVSQRLGAAFEEALPVLEDWDFWCQLSHGGRFVHVPGVSAVYRQGLGDSHLSNPLHDNYWAHWHERILQSHAERWGTDMQIKSLAWHAVALNQAELSHADSLRAHAHAEIKWQQTQDQLVQTQDRLVQTQDQLVQTQGQLVQTQDQLVQTQDQLGQAQDQLGQTRQQLIQLQIQHQQIQQQHLNLKAESDLAQKSLQLLLQSRPVRWARTLRRFSGGG